MPFDRPTLTELRQQARGAFAARLPGADTTLRRSNITVSADVMAGLTNGEYGYLDFMIRMFFPDTAENEYLARWATDIFGISRLPAAKAAGSAVFTGVDGTDIPPGTIVQDNARVQFATQADGTIAAGTATIAIEALEGGANGNDAAAAPLTVVNAIAGIDANAVVDVDGLSGGTDTEDDVSLRNRLLAHIQEPPQGGIASDYVGWAKEVPGVTRAWAYPLRAGPGTVDVAFVMDGRVDIIPLAGDVVAVQDHIDTKRPVTDDCMAFAPTPDTVDYTVHGIVPNNADTQAAVIAAIKDMHKRVAVPGGGLKFQEDIVASVAGAKGLTAFNVTTPNVDVAGVDGTLLLIGDVTFT